MPLGALTGAHDDPGSPSDRTAQVGIGPYASGAFGFLNQSR